MKRRKKLFAICISVSIALSSVNMNISYAEKSETVRSTQIKYNDKVYEYNRFPPVYINDKKVEMGDMPAIITSKGRTLVPAREIFEALGAEVKWDGTKKQAYILLNDKFIVFTIDDTIAQVNGKEVVLDETAKLVYNLTDAPNSAKTMVPLRFVLETMDFDVFWDNDTYSIYAFTRTQKDPDKDKDKDKDNQQDEDKDKNEDKNGDKQQDNDKEDTNNDKDDENQQESNGEWKEQIELPTGLKQNPIVWNAVEGEYIKNSIDNESINKDIKNYKAVDIKNVEYKENEDGTKQFIINASDKISSLTNVLWENKLIVDIKNAKKKFTEEKIKLKDNEFAETIRSSQYSDKPFITRIVFDIKNGSLNYDISYSKDRKQVIIDLRKNYVYNISMKQDAKGDYLSLKGTYLPKVDMFRLTNPERLVVDIPFSKSAIKFKESDVAGQYVKKIRTSQFDENTTRVVLEMDGQPSYDVTYDKETTNIRMIKPTYKNIKYANTKIPQIILRKFKDSIIDLKDIKIENNYLDRTAKITLPSGKYKDKYGYGEIFVEDGNIAKIGFKDNKSKFEINIDSKHVFEYVVTEDANNYYINVMKPKEVYDKIVVVDPGHGGADPGKPKMAGNYTGMNEKQLNIDIGMKLYKMLENDPDIKVYMTRIDDSLPEKFYTADMVKPILQYRTNFANDIGADLFLSIHNNAYFSYVNGTETLYFNAGGKDGEYSKKIASIVHKNVMAKTKLKDKGLIVRNDLYVLRTTEMPAVLVELGYMTNKVDAAKLKTEAFRMKSAEGLYKGIVDALKYIVK